MGTDYILIVDDQPESIELIAVLIASYMPEMETDSAMDGETALEKISAHPPTLVLLDVKMPGMDGFEVCRRIKENPATADIPVMLISGVMVRPTDRVRGLNLGADGYVCKPFEPPELVAQVRSLLRLKRSNDTLKDRGRDLECELKQRAGDLFKSEQRYRTLVEQLPAITYAIELTAARRPVFISPQVQTLLGFSPAKWLAEPDIWKQQLHPEDRDGILSTLRTHDQSGEPYSMEYRILTQSGSVIWFRDEAIYLHDETGAPSSLHGVMLDITDRKLAKQALRESEEQLQHAHKMEALGRLSGGVAHDFNNLLTTILGYGRMLIDQIDDDALRADLNEIVHAGERAEELTRRLLAFGHKRVAEAMPLDLNDVVADMDRLLRRTLGKDIELVTLLGENLGTVEADEGQIAQVIMNLSVNARNAMPGGGKLTIATTRTELNPRFCASRPGLKSGPYVLLEVRDTGCGIQPGVQERIFEPFFTTRQKGEGTGLGLSIVYGIVRQCGGHIELQSVPSQGTRFCIYLPSVKSTASRPKDGGHTRNIPEGRETILLVEDEPSVRRLTSRMLSSLGYRIIECRHGGDALRTYAQQSTKIDLVLSDVVMPHLGGPELIQQLVQQHPHLKVLFMTGFTQQSTIIQKGRAFPILLKPFTRESLAQAVRDVLDVDGTAKLQSG